MNPSKFGDTYEMAKMCFLRWLAPDQPWAIHPMYFPKPGKPYNANFLAFYANFLGISCVEGNIVGRAELCNAVLGWTGSLFLDPDTGLWLNPGNRKHVGIQELITIADSATRKRRLTLVYDQSINRDDEYGTPREQISGKLNALREAHIHAAAYLSHIAFIWVSDDPRVVSAATRKALMASKLPPARFVDDGCRHI